MQLIFVKYIYIFLTLLIISRLKMSESPDYIRAWQISNIFVELKRCCYKLNSSVLAIILTGRRCNALCNKIHILLLPLMAILCNIPTLGRNLCIYGSLSDIRVDPPAGRHPLFFVLTLLYSLKKFFDAVRSRCQL